MSVSSASASTRPAAPVKKRRDIGDLKIALVFILPCLIGFGLFFLWPTIRGFYLSFTNYDGGNKPGKWETVDRNGNAMTVKYKGKVEPYLR